LDFSVLRGGVEGSSGNISGDSLIAASGRTAEKRRITAKSLPQGNHAEYCRITDRKTGVLSCLMLGTIAVFSALVPARRAASVDPIEALRFEAGG